MLRFIKGLLRRRCREQRRSTGFPTSWLAILNTTVPLFRRLNEADREELKWRVEMFVDEKQFEGCGGLTITDEMTVVVAAYACLLLLRRDTDCYPHLYSILLYPSAFLVPVHQHCDDTPGIVHEGVDVLCGEASPSGTIVLSWDEVRLACSDDRQGSNVVLHECAHLLDMESGTADGTPVLAKRQQYAEWTRVFDAEYMKLRRVSRRGRHTVLDEYGAEHPAEFFAVATEAFFETPVPLKQRHPVLYRALQGYYQQNPAAWPEGRAAGARVRN